MTQEQPRRKQRIPLSPEELFYFKELKKLKEAQRIQAFKNSAFYKILNRINIALAGFLTYCIVSLFILSTWEQTYVLSSFSIYGERKADHNDMRTISELQIKTTNGKEIEVYTDNLFEAPQNQQEIYLGKDLIFNKIFKLRLSYDERDFWSINAYASLTVCCFALVMGFFIYQVNKHLSHNGLLMVFGLFTASSLYFILI